MFIGWLGLTAGTPPPPSLAENETCKDLKHPPCPKGSWFGPNGGRGCSDGAPFECTSGAAKGGCSHAPWDIDQDPGDCQSYCMHDYPERDRAKTQPPKMMNGKMPTPESCAEAIAQSEERALAARKARGRSFDQAYLSLSMLKGDTQRRDKMRKVAAAHYSGGLAGVIEIDGVFGRDPTQTCSLEYGRLLAKRHLINRTGDCSLNPKTRKYWCTNEHGMTEWPQPHHWGCGHSHLIAWLSARGRKPMKALLTQEADGYIGSDDPWGAQMWAGNEHEFDDVVDAIVQQESAHPASPETRPAHRLRNSARARPHRCARRHLRGGTWST